MKQLLDVNSLEGWLALLIGAASSEIGAELVLCYGEQDRDSGQPVSFGRQILEDAIKRGDFVYHPHLDGDCHG